MILETPSLRDRYRAHLSLAASLAQDGQHCGAELLWKWYLAECDPQDAEVLFDTALMIEAQAGADETWRRTEAAEFYDRALCSPRATMRTRSDALQNIGVMMHRVGRTDKACIALNLAIQIDPSNLSARRNFAEAMRQVGKFEEADAEYEHVLRLDENDSGAHFSRGMIALLLGDYARGWAEYEWRFQVPDFPSRVLKSIYPIWKGEPLDGKTIVLEMEQGMGDVINFIRYAAEIRKHWPSARIWFFGHELLWRLVAGAGVDESFNEANEQGQMIRGEVPHAYDFHIPLLSLPHVFGTTLETVPATAPYIEPREDWPKVDIYAIKGLKHIRRSDYRFDGRNLIPYEKRIGLVWKGSPSHGRDRWRSLEPEAFQPIIDAHPECRFYSLQVGLRQHEVSRLRNVIDMAPTIVAAGDWSATAQVLLKLDLLVSVDTGTAHLAGALGRPTWMLTPFSPDFRWGLTGESTVWYPHHRLFRQSADGDWASVLQRINTEL